VKKWVAYDYKNIPVYEYDPADVLNRVLKIIEQVSRDMSIPNKFISIDDYLEKK